MSSVVSHVLSEIELPKMFRARQIFSTQHIPVPEIPQVIHTQLSREPFYTKVRPGMHIAITVGSRGVANVAAITKAIADFVKSRGAFPFVVPAMGSHGGGSAEGQLEILHSYGVTEETIQCPIRATAETTCIGQTGDGQDVYIDKFAAAADGIIVACRVKPHTAFRGSYESGIMKMMAIGLGKQYGASRCHDEGFANMAKNVPLFGGAVLKHAPVLFAVPVIENAYEQTCHIEAVDAGDIAQREPELLQEAFGRMPRILVPECEVLVVDEIGKNYSGSGLDPNVTGTFVTPYASGGLKSQQVAILDVSAESAGHAQGVGCGTAITRRLFEKMDLDKMYLNAITSTVVETVKIPCIMASDREAIQLCVRTSVGIDRAKIRIVRIKNSLEIGQIWLSESYYPQIAGRADLIAETEPEPFAFDDAGNLQC